MKTLSEVITAKSKSLVDSMLKVQEECVLKLMEMGATVDELEFENHSYDDKSYLLWRKGGRGYELKRNWKGGVFSYTAEPMGDSIQELKKDE